MKKDDMFAMPTLKNGHNTYKELISEEGIVLWDVDLWTLEELGQRRSEIRGLTRHRFDVDLRTMEDSVHLVFEWYGSIIRFGVTVMSYIINDSLPDYPRALCNFQGCLSFKKWIKEMPLPDPKPTRIFQGL